MELRRTRAAAMVLVAGTCFGASLPTSAHFAPGSRTLAQLPPRAAQPATGRPLYLPATLKSGTFPEPTPPTSPTPDPFQTPTPGAHEPASIILNEVGGNPPQGGWPFVEIANAGIGAAALDGTRIANSLAQTVTLPAGLPPLPASGLAVVVFDGQNRVETTPGLRIHADLAGFMSPISDTLTLSGSNLELLDEVAWGSQVLGAVKLGSGGVTLPPPPGSAIGRVPGTGIASSGEWALYSPADATLGEPNGLPSVDAFPMEDGRIESAGQLNLAWYPQAGAERYRVQLAQNEAFDPVLADTTVETSRFTTPTLVPGEYVWRVQALGSGGASARFSAAVNLTVEQPEPPLRMADSVTLSVPMYKQRKDTEMLLVSRPSSTYVQEIGQHAWNAGHPDLDPFDPADAMNCALAVVAMTAGYYQGNISQDRIGFQLYRFRAEGPEDDLNWGFGVPYHDVVALLQWAVSPGVVGYLSPGDNGDYSSPPSNRERELFAESVKLAIDNGQPVPICGAGHCVIVYGYTDGLLGLRLHINDPWTGPRDIRASRIPMALYAIPPASATGRLDENSVHVDTDGDRIVDFDETERFGTSPTAKDSDGDHISDFNEVKLSMFDDDHGFAVGKDARDNMDADGRDPELDMDSDEGGCADGLEDLNRNGLISPDQDETSPFEPDDDRCIAGTFTLMIDSDIVTEHQIHHTEIF